MVELRFFTTGCTNKNIAELPALIERHEAHLADIRLTVDATSIAQRGELQRLFGLRYRRVAPLGSRLNKAGETVVAHLALGLRIILSWQTNVILLCECERLENCHRAVIARELRRQSFAVEELAHWQTQPPLKTTFDNSAQIIQSTVCRSFADDKRQTTRAKTLDDSASQQLQSGTIALACGNSDGTQQTVTVAALIADGLGIHTDNRDPSLHAITHLATGRRVCTAQTLAEAQATFGQLQRLGVDWTREVPWESETEANRLKASIKSIVSKANKD